MHLKVLYQLIQDIYREVDCQWSVGAVTAEGKHQSTLPNVLTQVS